MKFFGEKIDATDYEHNKLKALNYELKASRNGFSKINEAKQADRS